ncbi:MAG: autotransporter domain-containing protein [Novosphingobium sp.]|uniref:autotransporter outer membrane beta-barrel domain-containing protein n=1 Tax=Novosphingobium sp. TaxID=1874826 RepID=UPI0032B9CFE9
MKFPSKLQSRSISHVTRPLALVLAAGIASTATPALAQCVADGSGLIVTCSGTSGPYVNTNSGVVLTAQSGGTVTGPMVLGSTSNTTNNGTFNGAAGSPILTVGASGWVTNSVTGTFAQSGTTAGSEGVVLGDNSTFVNNGRLTAPAGFTVARFGSNGAFLNSATAPAQVVGNVVFGPSLGGNVSSFDNQNTAFGFLGNVTASGNLGYYNAGKFTGNVVQQAAGGTVSITNAAGGTFIGALSTGDSTVVNNAGTMTLNGASVIASFTPAGTSFTNTGQLNLGTANSLGTININGSYTQSAAGTLGITIGLPGTTGPIAGTTFSQLRTTGTANLGGTLALTVINGYYPTNSTYNVVVGDTGVTGSFSSITGNQLTFITFVPVGVVTVSGSQQAYQLQVQRTTTYAAGLGSGATANQLAVATAFQPMVAFADTHLTSDTARLVGAVDVLTAAEAKTFFDSVSPAGYLAYANSMRDHASKFQRQITLRLDDFNAEQPQRGWWANFGMTALAGSVTGTDKTKTTGYNFAAGYDFSGPSYVAGIALGYAHGTLKYGPGTLTGKDSAYQIGGYTSIKLNPLVANVVVDYQFGKLSAAKTILIGAGGRAAAASSNSHLFTGTATLGANLETSTIALRPFAGVQIHKGAIDGFTETGAGAANLSVGRINADRTDLIAGATLTRNTGTWRPYVRGTYRSLIGTASTNAISASFTDVTGTGFSVTGRGAGKTEFDVDAGLNWVSEDEGGLYVAYQGTFRDDRTSHGVVAGIRIQF